MNKQKLMQLNDYVKDKSKARLEILVGSGNKINKTLFAHLTLAIDDWVKTPSPQRLKIIENMLGGKEVNEGKQPIRESNKLSKLLGKKAAKNPLNLEMQAKRKEIEQMSRSRSQGAREQVTKLTNELYDLELASGLIQTKPVEMWTEEERQVAINLSNESIVVGCLGDYTQDGTFASEILFGNRPRFTITRDLIGTPEHVIKLLEKMSGSKAREFYIVTLVGNGAKPVYEFTDKQSGLTPSSTNQSKTLTAIQGA